MRILANRALAGLIERGVALQDYARLQTLLDETTLKLIEGQYLDIDFEDRFDITTEDYLTMISGKTVALFACALEAGAIAGGGSRQSIEDLHSCGEYLGYAFQIRDDVLGIWGEQEQTGKPHASDILQKKKSLPIIYAFEYAGQKDRDTLQSLYNNQSLSEAQVETVLQILERTNARKEVGRIEQQYSNTLQELVNKADISEAAREAFNEITAFLMQREY
jgi:geranylgeranyl diphosphate synthase type I